jgi:uncharacterized protein YdhG (YjbR/CyaY superfamily)
MPAREAAKKIWSDVERAAMQESAKERKKQAKLTPEQEREAGDADIAAKIAEMSPAEQAIAEKFREVVASVAPHLVPRTYYGMPAYARDGKVICFFQPASKFKVRYNTLGFQPDASLDEGDLWPVAFAVTKLSPTVERRMAELIKQAAG